MITIINMILFIVSRLLNSFWWPRQMHTRASQGNLQAANFHIPVRTDNRRFIWCILLNILNMFVRVQDISLSFSLPLRVVHYTHHHHSYGTGNYYPVGVTDSKHHHDTKWHWTHKDNLRLLVSLLRSLNCYNVKSKYLWRICLSRIDTDRGEGERSLLSLVLVR